MYFMGIYEVRHLSDLISQRTCIEGANIYVVVHYGQRLSGAGVLCVPELTSGSARSYASTLTFGSVGFEAGSCL